MFRRVAGPFFVTSLLTLVACGGGGGSDDTLAPLVTTGAPSVTTVSPSTTTTSSTSSTSTSTSSTTTTIVEGAELFLRSDGLGTIRFGVEPDGVVDYVSSLLGDPDSDTGYIDSLSEFGTCPGTEVRGVRWGDLLLLFGDESDFDSGRRHFYQWQFGPQTESPLRPNGPLTDGGIGLGATVADIRAVYPDVQIFDDDIFGPGFEIEPLLWGTLTDDADSGRVIALVGGTPCGE
ncbi:MAG: hypothetical protein RIS41_908 [Actinomycetota bacterium]|jgi:hypothetical protein